MRLPKTARVLLVIVLAFPSAFSVGADAAVNVDLELQDPSGAGVLVHASPGMWREALATARSLGLRIGTTYPEIRVFVARGPRDAFLKLAGDNSVASLEPNARLRYGTDTSHDATRSNDLYTRALRVDGKRIDGRGIGVAIVDSGVDGTHPDLVDRMGGNVRIVCTAPGFLIGSVDECRGPKQAVELENTDILGGHGTHVAGIVAGTGEASVGEYHGAAPGATLYGVGMGTVLIVENALDGLRWVLDNHDLVKPRIRVLNASWGSGYDPEQRDDPATAAITKMIDALVAEGVTVVFSAANSGGDGSSANTSLECTTPTPGVICVANYDDGDMGSRRGEVYPTSARGEIGDPTTWPDISAPGARITSTCRPTLPVCNFLGGGPRPNDYYATLSGTSMAAPHITGIVAQLLQARPSLTPRQIEDVLEDTAYKFKWGAPYEHDPANPDDASSFEKGHGLVDVLAALRSVI